MFVEINDLSALVISPAGAGLKDPKVWGPLAEGFDCVFLVPGKWLKQWKGWAESSPSSHVLDKDEGEYINPVSALIKRSLELLDAQPYNAAYITFDPDELKSAANTRVGTLLIQGEDERVPDVLPDLLAQDASDAITALKDFKAGMAVGYIAETYAHTPGTRMTRGRSSNYAAVQSDPFGDGRSEDQLVVLGRYFPSSDARHLKHPLTQRILAAKRWREPIVIGLLWMPLKALVQSDGVDIITRVPPKPSDGRDRLAELVQEACAWGDERIPEDALVSRFKPELLKCIKDYPPQKTITGGKSAREDNVKGAFRCRSRIDGKHVLLVDDVVTSGATAAECARMLHQAGAQRVTVLAIGKDQKIITGFPGDQTLECPKCESVLYFKPKMWDQSYEGFWGCSTYRTLRCDGKYSLSEGLRLWNQRNTRDMLDDELDIFPF